MKPIISHKSIYDTAGRSWILAIEVEGEDEARRFPLASATDAELLIESFEDSSYATFDSESGEISFVYEYEEYDEEDEEEEDEEDEDEDGEDEDEDEEDENAPRPGPSR